jgi:hypothetical protein
MGLAKINWLFGESSKASITTLLLLNPYLSGGSKISPVPKIIGITNDI